ncbi:DNA-directed DNA polymerase [Camelimonas fluminis]|uniref:DNA polymerase III subunit alpha n=1 Tax=Camelimonas fluminis TaxID=1576911 RepID=A0ABV7UJ38_9HYPH|nr:DNA polymerase III subunit alpha [Camelimonas fluminis]GHE73868.1 DNA-directed DNA polymerase [Camelimonas fluminis]
MLFACETHYSRQRRSTIDPKALVKMAKDAGYSSVGIADRMSLAAAYDFSQAAEKAGIKPLIGVRLPFTSGLFKGFITLSALNPEGWANLIALNNRCHIEKQSAPLTIEDLISANKGVFATTGGLDGPIDAAIVEGRIELADEIVQDLAFAFGNRFAIAFERHDSMDQRDVARECVLNDLATRHGLPGIAMSPVRHRSEHDRTALDVLTYNATPNMCLIGDPAFPSPPFGSEFKTPERLNDLFADSPQLLRNGAVLAESAKWSVPGAKPHLPRAKNVEDEDGTVIATANAGLQHRLRDVDISEHHAYHERLSYELGHITNLKFSGYFLIVADFCRWCRSEGIPVGPGRGSGAGSLVAWTLGITDIDPIRWGLLFERFINPERVSLPDFDIDFCERRRGEVLDYVREFYGADYVAQIAAYTTMQPKGAFKAAARAIGIPPAIADSLSKKFPEKIESFQSVLDTPAIKDAVLNDLELRDALDIASTLVGVLDSQSEHAAGVVISDESLYKTTPLMGENTRITQYSMKPVENTGLVKFDFLGLKSLSVITRAWDLAQQHYGFNPTLNRDHIPFEDPAVFRMINQGRTLRLFQIENRGMTRALLEIGPTQFEDLIAIVALYRPGPMDQIPLYAARKAGRASVEYPHPKLEPVLAETYGIFVYQEQIISAAQVLAGYTLGQADVLRRAIGKKIAAELKAGREGFVSGCEAHSGIPRADGEKLFDTIEKFADYGFNKSHAAAYALICWVTACLKCHYPLAFACANLDFDARDTAKVEEMIRECERMQIPILQPDINASRSYFTIDNDKIRYGLRALTGISEATADMIDTIRGNNPFRGASDAALRLLAGGITKGQLTTLINAGAFDSLLDRTTNETRAHLVIATSAMRTGKQTGGPSLFEELAAETEIDAQRRQRATSRKNAPHDVSAEIEAEIAAIGFRLARHPAAQHQLLGFLVNATSVAQIKSPQSSTSLNTIGLVEAIYEAGPKRPEGIGPQGVEMIVSDQTGRTRVFAPTPNNIPPEGAIAVLTVQAHRSVRILQSWSTPRDATKAIPPALILETRADIDTDAAQRLEANIKAAIRSHGRGGNHRLITHRNSVDGTLAQTATLINRVNPTPELMAALQHIPEITRCYTTDAS